MVWYGFKWHRETILGSKIIVSKMFPPICSQSADSQLYLQSFARRVFTTFSQSAFYNNSYTIHTDTLFPVFFLFLFTNNECRGSRFTFIVMLQFLFVLFFSFKSICQQRELPLLFDASAVKCGSYLLLFGKGECDRGYLYCRSLNRGFKGWYGNRDDLYYWLPKREV